MEEKGPDRARRHLACVEQSDRSPESQPRAGPTGLAAGAVGEALDVAAPTLSFHLKELKRAGLVGVERVGRSQIYRAGYDAMSDLLTFLTDQCCEGVAACAPRTREDIS